MAATAEGTWLQKMAAGLAKVKVGGVEIGTAPTAEALSGPIDTKTYLEVIEQVAPIYDCLLGAGMGSTILKKDIGGTCSSMREKLEGRHSMGGKDMPLEAGATLQGIVDWGMANVDRKKLVSDPMSTVRAVRWIIGMIG